jgi:hypothetical protein
VRKTIKLDDDALLAARLVAQLERVSLGEAISQLIRRGASETPSSASAESTPLRGRFALLPVRGEVITVAHVRGLMEGEGIRWQHQWTAIDSPRVIR